MVLLLAVLILTGVAWSRGAEYDEQYTVFILAGDPRPTWPAGIFTAADVRDRFHGTASPSRIAADLRQGDVHPPLYFWAVSLWSRFVGGSLFGLRLFSVLCSVASLATVGLIAARIGVPASVAMLLTLGCYAFAYTACVARGFALAQLLALLGMLHALRTGRKPSGIAGLLFGAASFTNYLAAFTAVPVLVWLAFRRLGDAAIATAGFTLFAAADMVFFVAQRGNRQGQFPPFDLWHGALRMAKYAAAGIAGGIPLYVPAALAASVGGACAAGLVTLTLLVAVRWQAVATPPTRVLLAGAAIAPPLGLLALGLVFDNTPIELRYLAFAMPYAALLLAGALTTLPRTIVLAVQAAAIAGLMLRPETMQPMGIVAREAASLADPGTVVLLPHGGDGVGLIGAFVTEAPDTLRILIVDAGTRAAELHGVAPRLALALLNRDSESGATLGALRAGFAADPCWRAVPGGSGVALFAEACAPVARQASAVSTAR